MLPQFDLKDPQLEARVYGTRTIISVGLVMILLGVILMRYYQLQVTEYDIYRTQSERNAGTRREIGENRVQILTGECSIRCATGVIVAKRRPLPWSTFTRRKSRKWVKTFHVTIVKIGIIGNTIVQLCIPKQLIVAQKIQLSCNGATAHYRNNFETQGWQKRK